MAKQVQEQTETEKQDEYIKKLDKDGAGFDLVIGEAFIRGMRDIGYKHTGTAIDEIVDNAIEAGAGRVDIVFKCPGDSTKPEAIAIIDDGHGMKPEMLRRAVMWGGTHRENSRKGIGRYGYGLPSSSVSQGRRFVVYSKQAKGEWNEIQIDLDDIASGKMTKNGRLQTPEAATNAPPSWLKGKIPSDHGTIVIWEKLDRLSWKTMSGLTNNLAEHFGVTYRNFIARTKIKVADTIVEPIDPLFTTPGYRYFDYDEDRAVALDPMRIPVKVEGKEDKAFVTVRFARFPLKFLCEDKTKKLSKTNANPRGRVKLQNMGISVCRMGREIDLITRIDTEKWANVPTVTENNDRYWGVEIDFPAELDEEFSVTTSKQQIRFSERIWEILKNNNVEAAIRGLKKSVDEDQKKDKEPNTEENEPRPSERVMEEADKFKTNVPGNTSEEREEASRTAFEQEVKRRKSKEGKTEEQVREELNKDMELRKYRIEFEDYPDGAFFRGQQIGGQYVIYINRKNAFYSALYAAPNSNDAVRSALEILLFVLGQSEADAAGNKEKSLFYTTERLVWSRNLHNALELFQETAHFSNANGNKD